VGFIIQGESVARGRKLLCMYTVEQRWFLVRKYRQTSSFKHEDGISNGIS